ncbi:hypothetical protein [Candidatus Cyanaurora vandensis]|uniref:hypothetical protein n=1 Tax=Candidatus Cyanaurora vandensis TaxID=2714958 RepID=UPI00257AFB16|nr:hypothetical protein [Candidatus Cyanaurora vandensis]
MAELVRIENPQSIEAQVSGPGGADRLFIYTGVAVFNSEGPEFGWKADTLVFVPLEMPGQIKRVFTRRQVHKAIASAALAGIYNPGNTGYAGWAVDCADADWDDETGNIVVVIKMGINGEKAAILRLTYNITVLAEMGA